MKTLSNQELAQQLFNINWTEEYELATIVRDNLTLQNH